MNTEKCESCGHPLTAHTGTPDTIPYSVCARAYCGCKLLRDATVILNDDEWRRTLDSWFGSHAISSLVMGDELIAEVGVAAPCPDHGALQCPPSCDRGVF